VPSCAEGGVLGVLPGIIGTLQAMETIKLLLGLGEPLIGRLVLYDALSTEFHKLELRKDPACPLCGENPTITELIDYDEFCGLRVPAPAFDGIENCQISPPELKARLNQGDPLVLIDVREPHEYAICRLEGARLMPFSTFAEQVHELNSADETVLLCRNGLRSLQVVQLLWEAGFRKLYNLAGGLDAWATQVDPTMPRY
jgi:adenylyltransferase/sulfurtransferase